jgi:hypothetical protein
MPESAAEPPRPTPARLDDATENAASKATGTGRMSGWEAASGILAWIALASVLLAIVPLLIRMAVWDDSTLFDLAARSLLRRGYCYRELFIHGPPGMVLCQFAVRSLVGWSSEALRAADLVIFSAAVWLLVRGVQPRGLPRTASVWIAAALYLCYFSATEWAHCQSDEWMLLPALGALCLRQRQAAALVDTSVPGRVLARRALAEGVLWGVAFLIKPFVVFSGVPCLLVALVPASRVLRKQGARRRLAVDVTGLLIGGSLVGLGSVAALYFSGDWSEFLASTFGGWNSDYARQSNDWGTRTIYAFHGWQWPWSALLVAAIPLALVLIGAALRSRADPSAVDITGGALRLPLLAAFFLGWFFQSNYLQMQYEYHTLPAVLLGWALVLGWVCGLAPRPVVAVALPAVVLVSAYFNPMLTADRLALWGKCWVSADSDRLKDELARNRRGGHTSWQDLRGVTRYLQDRGARDREVTCWQYSTIPFYTESGLEPSNRFVFPGDRLGFFPSFKQTIMDETMNSPQRFVVMDLLALGIPEANYRQQMRFPRGMFDPFKPAAVYHSGRYVVLWLGPPPGPGNKPR